MGTARVITIAHNEADILPLFVRHYKQVADRITIYDNDSTDNTAKIAIQLGCEVISYHTDGCDRPAQTNLQNSFCKTYSDSDWLIVVDTDEFVDIDDLKALFNSDATIAKCTGYQMFNEEFSTEKLRGIRNNVYDKFVAIAPKAIQETNFTRGRHLCYPRGAIKQYPGIVRLYHFKHIGGIERILTKHANYMARIKDDRSRNKEYIRDNTIGVHNYLKNFAKPIE